MITHHYSAGSITIRILFPRSVTSGRWMTIWNLSSLIMRVRLQPRHRILSNQPLKSWMVFGTGVYGPVIPMVAGVNTVIQ